MNICKDRLSFSLRGVLFFGLSVESNRVIQNEYVPPVAALKPFFVFIFLSHKIQKRQKI